MFGFFKKRAGKSEATRTAGGPIISALLLEGESFPTDAFLTHVAEGRFAGKAASKIERGDGHVFSFRVSDELVALGLMPALPMGRFARRAKPRWNDWPVCHRSRSARAHGDRNPAD